MKQTPLRFGLVLALTVGAGFAAGLYLITSRADRDTGPTPERVTTADGRLSVELPSGWTRSDCPETAACLRVAPIGAGTGDRVTVIAVRTDPEADPFEYYREVPDSEGLRRFTLDGRDALRLDLDGAPGAAGTGPASPVQAVAFFGRMPEPGENYKINCEYERMRVDIRVGCERIAASLRATR